MTLEECFYAATSLGYSPFLIHDDEHSWAICDDATNSVRCNVKDPYFFHGSIEAENWYPTIQAAVDAYVIKENLDD